VNRLPLILDLTRLLPGPLAARMLAEMGYSVLRLEPPQGDLTRQLAPEAYAWLNRGKEVHTLDLKTRQGVAELEALAKEAGALLETNRPGVMERLGVGPEVLRAANPRLTYVRLAGYREEDTPGHDLVYLAGAGLLGRWEGAWKHLQIADVSGAFWAVLAAQQGMLEGGGFYEVYLAETANALAYPHIPHLDGGAVCYAVYAAQEGQVALAALEPHLWERFCRALNREDWRGGAFSPTRPENPLYREIQQTLMTRSAADWEAWAKAQSLPLRALRPYRPPEHIRPWRRD
jgi:crotonobetainyl-CoA:carnitine CoA-transferase CaiB-like acyl-CoA transferase